MKKRAILILILAGCVSLAGFSQSADSVLIKSVGDLKSNVDQLKKFKVSGLIHFQYQLADEKGAKSYAGGDFPSASAERITVRRGRFKASYTNGLAQYVIQMHLTESDFNVREVYMVLTDPWKKSLSLTSGVFMRPFGYDLEYAEPIREGMERSRMVQILFPGERDMGAMLQYAPSSGPMKFLNARAGLFAGNGVAKETDKYKDLIGRIGFNLPVGQSPLTISGGLSGYFGKQLKDETYTKTVSVVAMDTSGAVFSAQTTKKYGASTFEYDADAGKFVKSDSAQAAGVVRQYLGLDLQLNYKISGIGNLSVRGEYITGKNPGISTSSKVYTAGSGDLYLREFSGYYIWVVQDLGKKVQLYMKYDKYDPNTLVDAEDIGVAGSLTSAGDLQYTTLGFGASYIFNTNVKLSAYYDMVKNEKASNLSGYESDLKDNVFTLRLQYRF